MSTNDIKVANGQNRPSIIATHEQSKELKIILDNHNQSSKKPSFFIGDTDTRPTKIIGPDDAEIPLDEIIVPPDGGWGWIIVIASFLSNLVVDGIVFSFGILLNPIHEASNGTIPISTIAWVGSLATGFYFLAGPVVSAVANRFGFRVVAIAGSVIASLAIFGSWFFCREKPEMIVLFGLYGVIGGIGFGMIYVPAVIAVGFYFEKKRALATGIAICGSGIGTFLFPPIMNIIIEKYNWQAALLFQALIVLTCALFGLLYRPLKPQKTKFDDRRKSIASFASPDGTPLLMRIKKARDMEKWDSVNSFVSNDGLTLADNFDATSKSKSERRVRKISTHSLKSGGTTLAPHHKRMSVPAMLASGDISGQQPGEYLIIPTAPPKGNKSFVGVLGLPDLKEMAEDDHSEDASRENSQPPSAPPTTDQNPIKKIDGNENTSMMRNRNNSTFIAKIGSSTLTVDEMTHSRILRVASRVTLNKPMYRDDIFFTGSLLRVPAYAKNEMSSVEWSAAVSTVPAGLPPDESDTSCCSPNVVRKMLDVSLLVSPTFLILSISGFFTMLGIFVPFMYLKGVAMDMVKLDVSFATSLISIIGIANTAGRIISGWVADRPQINVLLMNNASLTIMGLSVAVVPLLSSFVQYVIFSCVFGLSMACFASLRSILLVELLGLEKLTNAFGLMLLFQGFAAILGSPLAGFLYEATGSYTIPFIVAGGFLIFSGVMCYPLNCIKNWESKREGNPNNVPTA